MNNQTKFSISNVTIDTDHNRAHQCPSCKCLSSRSRPISPHVKPFQRKANIYYQNFENNINKRAFSRNLSPSLRSQSPNNFVRPVSPKPKVTIRYSSPQRQRLSQYYQKGQQKEIKRPYSPFEKIPSVIPQTHISSSNVVMEIQEQPKKPSILNRHNSGSTLPNRKNLKISTTNNYYKQEDQKQVAETIIKELNLNYDYLTVNDVSDISADVTL